VNQQRPVNLNLFTIKFPLPAIISILHRASGVFMFLLIPFLLWMLSASLSSPVSFESLQITLMGFGSKFVVWLLLSALLYHLVAGIRHLLMDIGFGESLAAGRVSSKIVLICSIILSILVGIWLW
jgi:succinate dehydrogenase / fumarate reductase, cytochrome b subunit